MDGGNDQGRRYADGRSLRELALFSVLILFGIVSTVKECIHPSEHKSVRESLRELGEAVESEYGILPAAEDSSALESDPTINDRTDEQ
jgi:hypothetical protein